MPRQTAEHQAILERARERFRLADQADSDQAQRERNAIAFEAGDQWPSDIRSMRQGQTAQNGLPAVPARPTLTINKVREPVRQVLNQERSSDIGIEIVPADDFGDLGITPDDTEVTLREGLIRRIQRESIAADARTWAFKRAVIAGRGYYIVRTRYLPGSWDQEVYVDRIYNQTGVLLDPSHEQPDGSDAEWEFIGTWMPWDRYKAEYPEAAGADGRKCSEYSEADFISMTEAYPDWYRQSTEYTKDGRKESVKQMAVRVVSYWYVTRTTRTLFMLPDGKGVYEVPPGVEPIDQRQDIEKTIDYCLIGGGTTILEQTQWAGPDMPIVKVLGEEILPYDEQRRAEGMVTESAMSANQGLNYMASSFVERVGLSQIARDRLDPDAIDGYEAWWAVANTRTLPYLPYRTWDDQGREFRQPQTANVDPNILPTAQGISIFDDFVKSTTAVSDPALGQTDPSVKSAKHARYLIEESQLSTSNFLDNLARSCRYEGTIENNLLYPIYGNRPGRMVRILTGEGEGQMMRIGESQTPEAQQQQAQQQKALKVGKLTKDARFNVVVKVTKSTESRRDQFVRMFGEVLGADPMQMAVGGDLFYKNMDIPEGKQLAKRQRVMLAPQIQQMLAAEEEGRTHDPVAQAEIAQLQERVQLAELAMKEQEEIVNGKKLEAQTKLQIEQMAAQKDIEIERMRLAAEHDKTLTELQRAQMDNATKIRVAEIAAETKGLVSAQAMEHEAMALAHTQQHEAEMAGDQREHEARVDEMSMAHEAAMAEGSMAHESDEAERGRQAAAAEAEANREAAQEGGE